MNVFWDFEESKDSWRRMVPPPSVGNALKECVILDDMKVKETQKAYL